MFGVPPNTFRPAFPLSAANPGMNPLEEITTGVGRETRPTAIGTIALPSPCSLLRLSTESVEDPPQLTGLGGNTSIVIPNSGLDPFTPAEQNGRTLEGLMFY